MQAIYVKRYRVTGWTLLFLLYTGFVGWQLGRIQAITDFNYSLHEMLYIPALLCIYIGPVLFIAFCYYAVRAKVVRQMTKRRAASWFVIAVTLLYMVYVVNIQAADSSVTGIYTDVDKSEENGYYYIVLEDRMIQVSAEQYAAFDVSASYVLSYKWNEKQVKGNITYIEKMEEVK